MVIRGIKKKNFLRIVIGFTFLSWFSLANAQLSNVFDRVFDEILSTRIRFTPGPHGLHFIPAAKIASSTLSPALSSFMTDNITSFPIPTVIPNISFRMFDGRPVERTNSLGPIFAESAETIGKGIFTVGASLSYLNLNKLRGLSTNDIRFVFTHVDASEDGTLGDHPAESDVIVLLMNMETYAGISTLVATYGVADALDLSVVLPVISIEMKGHVTATVDSYTLRNLGIAVHRFNEDERNPVLSTTVPINEKSFGIGDTGLRLKYNFVRRFNSNAAVLLEVRLPLGNEENFMSTGKTDFRFSFISEQKLGGFSPHINVAYSKRASDFQNDRFEFVIGMEQRIFERMSFAIDLLGTYETQSKARIIFPEQTIIHDHVDGDIHERPISLSNIPNRNHDNTLDATVGFRFAPSDKISLLGNVLIPLNDSGLRSWLVPTVGFSVRF